MKPSKATKRQLNAELSAIEDIYSVLLKLTADQQEFVLSTVFHRLGQSPMSLKKLEQGLVKKGSRKRGRPVGSKSQKTVQPDPKAKAFLQDKSPKTDVQKAVVIAGYLTQKGKSLFKTGDVRMVNEQAGLRQFANPTQPWTKQRHKACCYRLVSRRKINL
ncbi:MAG: hypothetical protein H7A33_00765 [Deltaproteobacteria bacterium]|nr:hypothetical protein [Deltaproteobacteria bacterium]